MFLIPILPIAMPSKAVKHKYNSVDANPELENNPVIVSIK